METVLTEEPESPLTARIVEAPGTHDGSPFTLRFEFSDFVAQRYNYPKYAVTVTGGTVVNAWFPEGRGKELAIYVVPRPPSSNVHLVMLDDRPCSVRAAICTYNGRRLANRLEHTVYSIPPGPVDRPTGRALSPDSVALEWNEVRIAGSYEVQFRHAGRWTDLPSNGTEIEFDGATAVVRGLPGSHHHFRVRAVNSNGRSSWSDQLFLPLRMDWEGELATARTAGVLPAMSGYSAHGTVDGTLSPNTFKLEGTTYEVRYVVNASESVWLNIDKETTERLHILRRQLHLPGQREHDPLLVGRGRVLVALCAPVAGGRHRAGGPGGLPGRGPGRAPEGPRDRVLPQFPVGA